MKIGNEYLIPIRPDKFEASKEFMRRLLSGEVIMDTEEYFVIKDRAGAELGICPDENAPNEKEYHGGVWLSFTTSSFEEKKKALIDFGVNEVKGGDPNAFFFHFPGGPVFKLIKQK